MGYTQDIEIKMQRLFSRLSSTKTVNDVLKFGEGVVIEFEREAGEPVELLVNGTLIARGEVVEIEGNYGVRITEIMKAM